MDLFNDGRYVSEAMLSEVHIGMTLKSVSVSAVSAGYSAWRSMVMAQGRRGMGRSGGTYLFGLVRVF